MIAINRWQPSDGFQLEPNALIAATERERSLALTAGPGAGKTEMLAQRADFLFRTGICRYPRRILAISFKVDASRNLRARVRTRSGPELSARLDSYTFHAFAKRIIDRFRPVLTGQDLLDADYTIGPQRLYRKQITFQELVPLAVQILESSAMARNAVRQTYSHVFLDEFQDCTNTQYQLIKKAFEGTDATLTAVGDTKQRIMGWAGALEGIFEVFAADFDAMPLNLYQNFRSDLRLRRMQNAMVKIMDSEAAVVDSELLGGAGTVEILEFADSQQEAEALAERIADLIDAKGIEPSEIAVLVSKQPELYCDRLELELAKRGVAFRNEQSLQDLSCEPAALLIVDFLLVIVGRREPVAYRRLLDALMSSAQGGRADYEWRARWGRFIDQSRVKIADGLVDLSDSDDLREVIGDLLTSFRRESLCALSPDYEHGERLNEVIRSTQDRLLELMATETDTTQALRRFSGDSAVRLMTIHKSKGLEFDTVIMLAVEKEAYWGRLLEERSSYFVGISRAKHRLYLTIADHRERPDGVGRWTENRTRHDEFLAYAEDA